MKHDINKIVGMFEQITPASGKKIIATTPKGNSLEFPYIRLHDSIHKNLPELVFTSGEWVIRYTMQAEAHNYTLVNYKVADFSKIEIA